MSLRRVKVHLLAILYAYSRTETHSIPPGCRLSLCNSISPRRRLFCLLNARVHGCAFSLRATRCHSPAILRSVPPTCVGRSDWRRIPSHWRCLPGSLRGRQSGGGGPCRRTLRVG